MELSPIRDWISLENVGVKGWGWKYALDLEYTKKPSSPFPWRVGKKSGVKWFCGRLIRGSYEGVYRAVYQILEKRCKKFLWFLLFVYNSPRHLLC